MALGDLPAQAYEGRYPAARRDGSGHRAAGGGPGAAVAGVLRSLLAPARPHRRPRAGRGRHRGRRAAARVRSARRGALPARPRRPRWRRSRSSGPTPTAPVTPGSGWRPLGAAIEGLEPTDPAYTGLATQYVAALIDAGRAGEAVTYAETAVERLRAVGREASWELGAESARALLAAGRAEDALTALQAAAGFQADDPVAKEHRDGVRRALILATLGRIAEAVDALPDLDVVGEHPRVFVEWAHAVSKLADSSQITNTWQLGRVLRQWIDYFGMMGGYRARVELSLIAGELAIARQGVWQARLLADLAESAAGELRDATGVAERIAELRAAADAATEPPGARPRRRAGRLLRRRRRLQRRPRALGRLAGPAVGQGPRGHPPPHHHARLPRLPARPAPTSTGRCSSTPATSPAPTPTTSPTSPRCSSRRVRTSGWSRWPRRCRTPPSTWRWPACTAPASAGRRRSTRPEHAVAAGAGVEARRLRRGRRPAARRERQRRRGAAGGARRAHRRRRLAHDRHGHRRARTG